MLIPCPHCGVRDVQEFEYLGAAGLRRPDGLDAHAPAMFDYVYMRDNPMGPHRELWFHRDGCGSWLVVERDTRTHEIRAAVPARETSAPGPSP